MKKNIINIPLQPASEETYNSKYRLTDEFNNPVDKNIEDTYVRVARALSNVEVGKENRDKFYTDFLWALNNGAIPAGRITSNAGADIYKSNVSLINCVVSGKIEDNIDGIMQMLKESALSLAVGNGIGYEFSTIRPKGSFVSGVGAKTSGVLPFMDIYDKMCFTIASAGGRRGAQMATFDIRHPEVLDFIKAKREEGRFSQFNLSVLITNDFINAVKKDLEWVFSFPITKSRYKDKQKDEYIWRDFPTHVNYVVDNNGLVACERYSSMPAKELWDVIMESNYDYAEPGFILIDKMNEMNPLVDLECIRSTNPCAEQPLPPYGSCLLGSINLTKFVINPFTKDAYFDYEKYILVIRIFSRMLDNVVEVNGLILPKQKDELESKRRHGMGYLGLGSSMVMLNIRYGSSDSIKFTDKVTKLLSLIGYEEGVKLAKEKGPCPTLQDKENLKNFINSPFIKRLGKDNEVLINGLLKYGCRYTHCASIAPTGSISFSLGNNASNGVEPSFAHQYKRNVIVEGKDTKQQVTVYSYESLAYNEFMGKNIPVDELPEMFVDTDSITPKEHIDVQATAQYWLDSSTSKTVNVPSDIPYEDFKDIYMYAVEKGCKGVSTYRPSGAYTGVLIKDSDLESTLYEFTLDNNSVITAYGNEEIEYKGDTHNVANLYHAINTKVFGKL